MHTEFWLQRWQNGETGFHQDTLNPYLEHYYGEQGPSPETRHSLKVFVPLCGKSLDMYWLAQNGYAVLGVECSDIAVTDFFKIHKLDYAIIDDGAFKRYVAEADTEQRSRIEILLGDFFDLQQKDLEGVTHIYDRASMIALPENMRQQYSGTMAALQRSGVQTLLITLTYPQQQMDGPPFSVTEDEVNDFYGANYAIKKLVAENILANEPRFQQRGVSSLIETAYLLTRR